jgi:predicted dehydrogenase
MPTRSASPLASVRVGIVGLGIMGQMYADALLRSRSAEVAAVATRNGDRREFAQQTYGCRLYEDYQDMYTDGGLDAVLITVPDFMHRDPVVKAAEAGLHILVEKPFAMNVADADAMVEAIDKAGVKCMVEFFNRWSSPFSEAKRVVDHGELGEVVAIAAELNDAIWVPTEMLKWSARTSPVWFLMSHIADLATWITGKKPATVQALGVKKILVQRGIDTYDLVEALVEYADGTLGRFSNCWILPDGMPLLYELKMRIVGAQAAIDIDTSDQELHLITQERLAHPVTAWGEIAGRYVGHPYAMLDAFIHNIVEDTVPLIGPMDGWENTAFLAAVEESIETGRKIRIQQSRKGGKGA